MAGSANHLVVGREIERKWLVSEPGDHLAGGEAQAIRQGYLTIGSGGDETRIRAKAGRYTLTTKSGTGMVRGETEITLSEDQFQALWPATERARVEKVRHTLTLEVGLTVEVDVYAGALAGLVVAEVEFEDEHSAAQFTAPAWFGPEVTTNGAYKNHALAVHGRP